MRVLYWRGDSEALNELHELIHYIVDESPLIKVKDGFMLSLPMIFVKHGKVIVVLSNISMINMIHISFYGVELLWPLVVVQSSNTQKLNGVYIQTDKNQLSVIAMPLNT